MFTNIMEILFFYLNLLTVENTDTLHIVQNPEGNIKLGVPIQFECSGSNPLIPLKEARWILEKNDGKLQTVLGTGADGMIELVFNDTNTKNIFCRVRDDEKNISMPLQFAVVDTSLPYVPTGFRVVEITSRSVLFAWGLPIKEDAPSIKQYVIEYKKAKGSWVTGKERVIIPGSATNAKVNSLKPWTSFHFRIFAENEIGNSTPTMSLTVITAEDLPAGTPMNVEASVINQETLQVCWTPPPKEEWNGALLGFNVGYRKCPSAKLDPYTFKIVVFPKTVGRFYGLNISVPDARNEYEVVVQAFNNVGAGPLSADVTQFTPKRTTNYEFMEETEEPTPPPPPSISVARTADTSVVIHLKLPNGDSNYHSLSVLGFKLYYKEDYGTWTYAYVKPTKFSETLYEIEGLNCGFRYMIYAVSYDSKAESTPSEMLNVRTHGPRPGFCTDDRERPMR